MKNIVVRFILISFDLLAVYLSIVSAFFVRLWLEPFLAMKVTGSLSHYTDKPLVYVIVLVSLMGLSIYKHRHDFWEETYLIIKSLLLSMVLVLSYLALSKSIGDYSRFVVVLSFAFMALLIPFFKYLLKSKLSVFGLWKKNAEVASPNSDVIDEVFSNRYLGYVKSDHEEAEVVFFDPNGMEKSEVETKLTQLAHEEKELIFIPMLNTFNFAQAQIIELFNSRTNMIVLENALMKRRNIYTKKIADILLSILLLPLLLPVFALIIYLMKKEEPEGSIFFKQERIGKNGEIFVCYKFRSMREGSDKILEQYLEDNPDEVACYDKYHKYKNDPRITKIGQIMRSTSLDELPQIINVFKREMSLIGPRPYMLNEKEKIGDRFDMVMAVKPGITGLWQVSGRSDVDFHSRVDMDIYYTRNWNLWMDLVILLKTAKTVLFRQGAS
ncbi:sugar transferase [Sulfurovum sp.]|uniref:sugar transferase n=1 Tax=Sulfurovum sp. TaxID=1969726 RepID=UPI002867FB46|nr:sugar transferase [Sulfurovum sp.]